MKVFRGVYDVHPNEIDPIFIGQGSFGEGTHYAFEEEAALAYCLDDRKFGILYEATVTLGNHLELSSGKVKGLEGYRGDSFIESKSLGKVEKEFLTERIQELGYSSVSLRGVIDGGVINLY